MTDLSTQGLHAAARERIGLEDFGPPEYREALEVLLDSARAEGRMNEAGRQFLRATIVDALANRLEIQDWLTRHPEILEERIAPPIVVATGPRSGSTAAIFVLGQDPANRCLVSWQARRPCPPPRKETLASDPRIAEAMPMFDNDVTREFRRIHLHEVDMPDECHFLLNNAFYTPHYIHLIHTPSQYRWATRECDMRVGFRYHRQQLQLLQWRCPGERWALKNPPHLLYNQEIRDVYPGVTFVHIHRDPCEILGSICSLTRIMRARNSDDVRPHEIGRHMLEMIVDSMDRTLAFRDRHPEVIVVDIEYPEFEAHPARAMQRVYERSGIPLSDTARERMERWERENPPGKHGRHEYELSDYGIDLGEARERLAPYCQRFDVPFGGAPAG